MKGKEQEMEEIRRGGREETKTEREKRERQTDSKQQTETKCEPMVLTRG